ncbi:MAG TPA: hypothetical protein VGR25_09965 [bacterium]|nr:hypothetical protein [bacterium]
MEEERTRTRKSNGPAAAAILAAGAGTFTIGLMTTLAEAFAGLRNALMWYAPSGPLSGKTGVGIIVWLIAWVALATAWKGRDVNIGRVVTWTFVLLLLGFVGTFPPVFEAFAP